MKFPLTTTERTSRLPSPEEEAIASKNHKRFDTMPRPTFTGTPNQIHAANTSLESFLFFAHPWGFKAGDIEQFLKTPCGRSVHFWISNKPKSKGSGETRIAVEQELEKLDIGVSL
jgi:hypothetical protein